MEKKNVRTDVKAGIDALKDRLGERDHSFPTLNEVLSWALAAANEKLDDERKEDASEAR